MKKLPIFVLKACPCVGASLCSLCVPSAFGRRAGSEVSMGCFFLQGVLALTALVGSRARVGGTRTRTRCIGFLLCLMSITAQLQVVGGQRARAEALRELGFPGCDGGLHLGDWFGTWPGPEGLGLHFYGDFTFPPMCVP